MRKFTSGGAPGDPRPPKARPVGCFDLDATGIGPLDRPDPGPCVWPSWAVYVGVTTQVAIAESTEVAYERAFEEHWTDVFRFALAWTNDWAAAEDLAQEAYLRLWDHRGRLDWDRPVLPWLLVTTRRLATDRFRALRRRLSPASRPEAFDTAVQARWLDVRAAMATLSALERTALVMTAVEGATYEEASVVLGTSAGALRAAVSRARTKLEAA
jgi:RNA polymerase sigma-70 factor, ECF subfamily